MSDRRSPLAKARDEWMESPEGKSASDPTFLFKRSDAQYLRNRLVKAFIAGAEAQLTILMDQSLNNMLKKAESQP